VHVQRLRHDRGALRSILHRGGPSMAEARLIKLADEALDPIVTPGRVIPRVILFIVELDLFILLARSLL